MISLVWELERTWQWVVMAMQVVTILGLFLLPLTQLIFPKYPPSSPLLFPFWIAPFALFVVPVLLASLSMISFAFNLF